MKNPREIQNWHHVSAMLGNVIKRLNDIRVGEFDPARIEEYRNAIVAILYRLPLPIVFCSHNATTGEYALMRPNSVFEAYVHFTENKFVLEGVSHFGGEYATWNLSDKRRLDEEYITAEALTYTDSAVLEQVTDIITKLRS